MFNYKRRLFTFLILCIFRTVHGQSPWPSESWTSAVNLSSVMDPAGLTELSGLFWNNSTKRLYVSHGDGRLRVLQLNTINNTFSQIANVGYTGGPEGITQVNLTANEFYTIDEDNYQIRKYNHQANYSGLTMVNSWNILLPPSTMTNTGNTGPEGIAFVPDSFLIAKGFISQLTGTVYSSTKGMGGLIFVAHQNQGYIWVFDVNPNISNDFAFVGKYKTNQSESCDLAFDPSTALLYILHNISGNKLEVTDLSTALLAGNERKFSTIAEYNVSNPSGNVNVEGFAITPKCNDTANVSVWLCRDVESTESTSYKQDCLRWFQPFNAPGSCSQTISLNLSLNVFIEGLYKGAGVMVASVNPVLYPFLCDTVLIELHQKVSPYSLATSQKCTIDISGNGMCTFQSIVSGTSYYIVVKHRNSLETWSASPVLMNAALSTYTFSDAISKAYGNKMVLIDTQKYAIFSGDVDQNGIIDDMDFADTENELKLFLVGYLKDDINGDHIVESADYALIQNNVVNLISLSRP